MEERNPNRKSNRSFNLDKGGQHSFDLGKDTSRKFELEKDDEPIAVPVPGTTSTDGANDGDSNNGSKKSVIWIVIAVVVAAIIAIFCFRGCGSDKEENPQPDPAQQETPATPNATGDNSDSEEPTVGGGSVDTQPGEEATKTGEAISTGELPQMPEEVETPKEPINPQPVDQVVSSDVEAEALNVIRGVYGVGQERKDKLGSQYPAIQARVNQMKRQGLF